VHGHSLPVHGRLREVMPNRLQSHNLVVLSSRSLTYYAVRLRPAPAGGSPPTPCSVSECELTPPRFPRVRSIASPFGGCRVLSVGREYRFNKTGALLVMADAEREKRSYCSKLSWTLIAISILFSFALTVQTFFRIFEPGVQFRRGKMGGNPRQRAVQELTPVRFAKSAR
jgi:hypothetical protein